MKKWILTLLCSATFLSHAQNWNTVIQNDTTYYTVQASGSDSIWQGYLRCIWIDSSTTIAGTTTNIFYPSVRFDAGNVINLVNGDTWLGHKNIRVAIGDEYYFNQLGDSILLKPLAEIGDQWFFHQDISGVDYLSTVVSKDTMSIDGTLDSVKQINLQAYAGTTPIPSLYNSLPILLSKAHGFIKVFEFYCFPFQTNAFDSIAIFPFPLLPFQHVRMEQTNVSRNYANIDLPWKYKPGNEWIMHSNSLENSWIRHDSIMSSYVLSPTSIKVYDYVHEYHRYTIHPPFSAAYDTSYHLYATHIDTIHNIGYQTIQQHIPEHASLINPGSYVLLSSHNTHLTFANLICGGHLKVEEKTPYATLMSGYGTHDSTLLEGFGITQMQIYEFQISGSGGAYSTLYFKLDTCIEGIKINFKTLDVQDQQFEAGDVVIYPNPSLGLVNLILPEYIDVNQIELVSIQGVLLQTFNATSQINLNDLASGIYLLRIHTKQGTVIKKICRE